MGTGAGDATMELEAMRKDDSSWHPCRVSLCSTGFGLVIDFGNQDLEDIISNEEEALARLRIRSVPLQGEDCSLIEEGERVLATHKSKFKTLSFDAMVEKALRVRHSKRISCRCTFEIKWLHQDLNGATAIVPSSSLMKLAKQSISVHPTVAEFLKPLKSLSCSTAPTFSTVFEDLDYEADLHKLLEKQIEEIRNLADASEKEISEDILFGIKAGIKEQADHSPIAEAEVPNSRVQVPHERGNHFKRSTRSSSKSLQVNLEVDNPVPPASSIQEELPENRVYLSPLAARAALASIMSNLPRKLEFSIYHEEGNDFALTPNSIRNKKIAKDLLNGGEPVMDKLSSDIEVASGVFKSRVKTKKGASRRSLLVETSSEITNSESQNYASPSLSGSERERRLRNPAKASRLTRSTIKKDVESSTGNAETKTPPVEVKPGALHNKRLTRSAVHKQEENKAMEVKQRLEIDNLAQDTEPNSSEGNATIPDRMVPNKKPVSLPHADQTSSPVTSVTEERKKKRKTPNALDNTSKTEGKVSINDGNSESQKRKSISSKKQELRFSPRLKYLPRTRSANKC